MVRTCLVMALAAGWSLAAACASPAVAADEHGRPPAAAAADGDSGHGGHGDGQVNPLEWKADLAIWTAVVFLVLLAVLWRFAWGPISAGLLKREQHIADQIKHAEESNAEARRLLAEYHQRLAATQDEVRGILEQGRRQAEQVGREMVDKARLDAEREKSKAVREIEQATAAAMKELADRSASLAVDLAGKIVGQRLNAADHAELIQRTVARFPAQSGSN